MVLLKRLEEVHGVLYTKEYCLISELQQSSVSMKSTKEKVNFCRCKHHWKD